MSNHKPKPYYNQWLFGIMAIAAGILIIYDITLIILLMF